MARHLDLEEQEQLAELKHFWNQYGNFITWVLIVVFGTIAAYNAWQWWQRTQAAQAAVLFDEVERAAEAGDATRVERAFNDIRERYGRTTYAQQSALLAAKVLADRNNLEGAKAALTWAAEKSTDEGYQASARLRLAGLHLEAKAYDEALKQLSAGMPKAFEALAADRRGDVYAVQGKKNEAKAEYLKAWQQMEGERSEYRRLVEIKLNALGVDPQAASATKTP